MFFSPYVISYIGTELLIFYISFKSAIVLIIGIFIDFSIFSCIFIITYTCHTTCCICKFFSCLSICQCFHISLYQIRHYFPCCEAYTLYPTTAANADAECIFYSFSLFFILILFIQSPFSRFE